MYLQFLCTPWEQRCDSIHSLLQRWMELSSQLHPRPLYFQKICTQLPFNWDWGVDPRATVDPTRRQAILGCYLLLCHWQSMAQLLSTVTLQFGTGTRWHSWLRHCAISQKIAGSIPDGVIEIFHWHNPSGCTMSTGVDSASNNNKYQEYFLVGKGGRCLWLTTLPPSYEDCLEVW
jgi:hypothetical protein